MSSGEPPQTLRETARWLRDEATWGDRCRAGLLLAVTGVMGGLFAAGIGVELWLVFRVLL